RSMKSFLGLLRALDPARAIPQEVNRAFSECLRGLRKFGLREESRRFIDQMAALILQGRSTAALQASAGKDWPQTVLSLLQLAGGWLYFGSPERANEAFARARELLYSKEAKDNADGLFPQMYTNLAVTYVTALGQAPVEFALRGIEELFVKMRAVKDSFN